MNIKSLACLTAALAVGTALADIEIELGITKVVSPNKNTIVAVPYKGFTPGANITVADVVKTANLQENDLCYVMSSTASLYDAWKLQLVNDVLTWTSVNQVQQKANGDIEVTTSPLPSEKTLAPGSALWIVREGVGRNYSEPFYLWGSYEGTVPTSTVTASDNGTWNLIANTGDTAVSVDWLTSRIGTPVTGDQIVVPNNAQGLVFRYMGRRWSGTTRATTMIEPGMGCWVFKKGTGGIISWPDETPAE